MDLRMRPNQGFTKDRSDDSDGDNFWAPGRRPRDSSSWRMTSLTAWSRRILRCIVSSRGCLEGIAPSKFWTSKLTLVLLPILITLLWLLTCIVSTSRRMEDQHLTSSFYELGLQVRRMQDSAATSSTTHSKVIKVDLHPGERLYIAVPMPYLDINPLAIPHYMDKVENIIALSTVPVTLYVLTNAASVRFVDQAMEKLKDVANCPYTHETLLFEDLIESVPGHVCPEQLKATPQFCQVLLHDLMPLLFPWILPESTESLVYMSQSFVITYNAGFLLRELHRSAEKPHAPPILMAHEQTPRYSRAFSKWQKLHPATKLGRPLSQGGNPGYNPDLILMDLKKMRNSAAFRSYLDDRTLQKLSTAYAYQATADDNPSSVEDVLNLIAAHSESNQTPLVGALNCQWNRLAKAPTLEQEKLFYDCGYDSHDNLEQEVWREQ